MRIETIALENYRCFDRQEFHFAPTFNLVVGDNGSGKTSLLSGLSFALGSLFRGFPQPAEPSALDADVARTITYLVKSRANVEPQFPIVIKCVGIVDGEGVPWFRTLRKGGKTTWVYSGRLEQIAQNMARRVAANLPVVLPVLAYYGTGRIWKQRKLFKVRTAAAGSRFLGYLNCLDPASDEKRLLEWFKTRELVALQRNEPADDLEAVRAAIATCVTGATAVYWDMAADQLTIRLGDRLLRFRQLSDGYRNMLGMVADIAQRCVTLNPVLGAAAVTHTDGVVLIDEIDLHLHPKWQRRVVGDLTRAFPRVQFVATTHSPFVIQSLTAADAFRLLNLDASGLNDYNNKSVEDIAEQVQGAGEQARSERYKAMMAAAEEYFRALEAAPVTPPNRVQGLKDRLDELASLFSDDPAYHALLKVEREARSGGNGVPHAPR